MRVDKKTKNRKVFFVCLRVSGGCEKTKKLTFNGQFVCCDLANAYISIGVMIVSRPMLSTA